MTPTPALPQNPISTGIQVSATANTTRTQVTGVPTNAVLVSPNTNTNGVTIDWLTVNATGTTVAGIIVFWHYDGTNSVPVQEVAVTVTVADTTVTKGFTQQVPYIPKLLGANCKMYATSTVASQLVSVGMTGGAF